MSNVCQQGKESPHRPASLLDVVLFGRKASPEDWITVYRAAPLTDPRRRAQTKLQRSAQSSIDRANALALLSKVAGDRRRGKQREEGASPGAHDWLCTKNTKRTYTS